jgi:hypothetical protein
MGVPAKSTGAIKNKRNGFSHNGTHNGMNIPDERRGHAFCGNCRVMEAQKPFIIAIRCP